MKKVLIVEPSEVLREGLESKLRKRHRVYCCDTGEDALELLQQHHPDGMILNLSLIGSDGLQLLEEADELRPGAILALTTLYTPYIERCLISLGVSYIILLPCSVQTIVHRMENMLLYPPGEALEKQRLIRRHLRRLGIPHRSGYYLLQTAIPLHAQDTNQSYTKELYPAVAQICGCENWQQVESAIRAALKAGWKNRRDMWLEYFPGITQRPSNKEFVARLAECLDEERETVK